MGLFRSFYPQISEFGWALPDSIRGHIKISTHWKGGRTHGRSNVGFYYQLPVVEYKFFYSLEDTLK